QAVSYLNYTPTGPIHEARLAGRSPLPAGKAAGFEVPSFFNRIGAACAFRTMAQPLPHPWRHLVAALQGEGQLPCSPRRYIRDRLHHGVADAGIVQRVARALDGANLGLAPDCCKRLRGRRRTEQIVAALHDDPGDAGEHACIVEQLVWSHEAVAGKV